LRRFFIGREGRKKGKEEKRARAQRKLKRKTLYSVRTAGNGVAHRKYGPIKRLGRFRISDLLSLLKLIPFIFRERRGKSGRGRGREKKKTVATVTATTTAKKTLFKQGLG